MVEVGPDTVRALAGGTGCPPPRALVGAALDWIDDPIGLLGDAPVAVADLWHEVMAACLGGPCESVVVVHPDDWPAPRVGRVLAAANAFADRVAAVSRFDWTPDRADTGTGEEAWGESGAESPADRPGPRRPAGRIRPVTVAPGLVVLVVLAGLGVLVALPRPGTDRVAPQSTVLTEGRIEVRTPAHWTVERITGGPGSRRVQVSWPADSAVALHITQSYAPETTLAESAGVLARAIAGRPAGVFVDFRADDAVAGRPAVTYREVRPGRVIRWAVLPAGATRISIGCQSPPEREAAVQAACDEAVRSARERGTESAR